MKGIITIIVIIAIIVVAFFILKDGTVKNNTEEIKVDTVDIISELEDSPIDTTVEIILVTYSNEGFAPKEISVAVGQTVRFVNESSGNMWVASDVHPAHKIMPEFDEKKSIRNGEIYEFTFTKTGEWKYHNHVKPSAFGTVIVE